MDKNYLLYCIYIFKLSTAHVPLFICLCLAQQPSVSQGLLIREVSRSHTTTHHSWWDSSGRVIRPSQRPLLDNTQHSQQTDILAPGGIRTHNLSRRAAADLLLIPRGHWDRSCLLYCSQILSVTILCFSLRFFLSVN